MKKRVIQLTLLVIVFLFIYNTYTLEREMFLKYKGSNLDPDRFAKNFLSTENQSIIDSAILTDEYRYVYGRGMVGDVMTDFIFDTKNKVTMDFKEYEEVTSKKPEYDVVNYKDGSIKLVNSGSGKTIFKTNLVEKGYIAANEKNLELDVIWSNTKRYLQLRDLYSRLNILIDMKSKTIIDIPIEGERVIEWSPSDEMVIIYLIGMDEEYPDNDIYLWDIKNRKIESIGKFNNRPLQWTPDGEYIYYSDTHIEDGPIRRKIVRYDVKNKILEDIYKSKGSIVEESIKWISGNELVFIEVRHPKTLNPLRMLMKPHDYYAVKVDVKKNRVKEKKLRAVLARSYVWSYDNKYLYYTDQRGFFKAKVNFD